MDVSEVVAAHYGAGDLVTAIFTALEEAGVDTTHLSVGDLGALDHLHAGFASATRVVLEHLGVVEGTRLLDVGSGLGGASRMAAHEFGATVTGCDLTPEFVRAATELTSRMGLADRVDFQVESGDHLPLSDASRDSAMMIHVGMNLPDKTAVFTEVHRVLRPGGTFAVYDQMQVGPGELTFPLPWSDDARSSFVESPDQYAEHLARAGFTVLATIDRTADVVGPPPPSVAGLTPGVVMGAEFFERLRHNQTDTEQGRVGAVLITAKAR
ncbi:MAG: class I SAM-dependent methyltransferase [Microlunatus sp.]|nr:class I SAM-dependent methyltransferase [Microlunatus sp.]